MDRVLFLCSGNYYRSRFAEIVFNHHAEERGLPWRAESRGLAIDGRNPGPISSHTLACLQERGILSQTCDRFPLDATEPDFAAAKHVVAVKEREHRPIMTQRFPSWAERVEYWQVHDLDCAPPNEAIPQLESHVIDLLHRLSNSGSSLGKC
jgi:protein-tyrosine phosphatase